MNRKASYLLIIALIFSIVGIKPIIVSADGYSLPNSYAPQETAVFINGKINILQQKTYLADDGKVYLPLKMVNKLNKVSLENKDGLTVTSPKGKFKINKTNSVVYKNSTYITLEKLIAITGYSGKYAKESYSVFLWEDYASYQKSLKIINSVKAVPESVRWYMGSKVYLYESNQFGWVTNMSYSGYSITDVEIQLTNGSIVNETIYDIEPSTFCHIDQYNLFTKQAFKNSYVWADKNSLPSSNPLYNIEKIKILSMNIKNGNAVIVARRASNDKVTFKIPINGFPNGVIYDNFYTSDPKKDYPNWTNKAWNLIKQQKISVGMTEEQVRMSWGSPNDISNYTSSYVTMNQWVYGNTYLHFYDGILNSWASY